MTTATFLSETCQLLFSRVAAHGPASLSTMKPQDQPNFVKPAVLVEYKTKWNSTTSQPTESQAYINQRVRIHDEKAPAFHKRKGKVVKVAKVGDENVFDVRMEYGGATYTGFKQHQLEIIPSDMPDPTDTRGQIERMLAEDGDDFACIMHEALAAFEDAKRHKEKELKREQKRRHS
jgi:hypothetical protein